MGAARWEEEEEEELAPGWFPKGIRELQRRSRFAQKR